jgi:hypothetical protein
MELLGYIQVLHTFSRSSLRHMRVQPEYCGITNLSLCMHVLYQNDWVFFSAMAGQLDGTLDYANADAVYLRVRGFTLRNEAPRLGRFLVADFMHYIAERRRSGVQTLFIIDEFNALRMREETSILFEQVRSFGGNLMISAQGYAGLGPHEYAERILDACSTYILHACSDPGPVSKRAGKRFFLETSWSEDEEGIPRKHIRPKWDWRVPESSVIQQEEGQAFWIYRGHAQHVQTAMVPITLEQVAQGWQEIRRQEEMQRRLLEVIESPPPLQQGQKQADIATDVSKSQQSTSSPSTKQKTRSSGAKKKKGDAKEIEQSSQQSVPNNSPEPKQIVSPLPDLDDGEPDRL